MYSYICPGCGTYLEFRQRVTLRRRYCPHCRYPIYPNEIDRQADARAEASHARAAELRRLDREFNQRVAVVGLVVVVVGAAAAVVLPLLFFVVIQPDGRPEPRPAVQPVLARDDRPDVVIRRPDPSRKRPPEPEPELEPPLAGPPVAPPAVRVEVAPPPRNWTPPPKPLHPLPPLKHVVHFVSVSREPGSTETPPRWNGVAAVLQPYGEETHVWIRAAHVGRVLPAAGWMVADPRGGAYEATRVLPAGDADVWFVLGCVPVK